MATESTRVDVRKRRSFTDEDKRRIVAEYRAAIASGEGGGVVLRREGLFQSVVHRWGVKIDAGTLGVRAVPAGRDPAKARVRELEEQLARARARVDTLEELVTAQGKCLALHVDVRNDSATIFPTTS